MLFNYLPLFAALVAAGKSPSLPQYPYEFPYLDLDLSFLTKYQ